MGERVVAQANNATSLSKNLESGGRYWKNSNDDRRRRKIKTLLVFRKIPKKVAQAKSTTSRLIWRKTSWVDNPYKIAYNAHHHSNAW